MNGKRRRGHEVVVKTGEARDVVHETSIVDFGSSLATRR
jgi:hypothetical protein